jgi:hypothetical protein
LNNKLYKYKYEAKKNYEQNPFALYLGAIIWEADEKWDDAYISYKSTYELVPDYKPLHEDLIRAAIRASRDDDLARWRKEFPEVKIKPEWKDPIYGELVLVYQQGWGPHKLPRPGSPRFPGLYHTPTLTRGAELNVEEVAKIQAEEIYSVENIAIKTLDDDFASLVGMRVAGVATKAVLADQIAQKNQLLGAVAFLALNASDRADLRQWSTLPETFQIARIRLKEGKYKVSVHGLTSYRQYSGENMDEREIEIRPRKKTFLGWRSVR